MYVEESLLWGAFRNVIDPPLQVKSSKDIVVDKLEEIPLINYLQSAVGRDLYGNKLNSSQREEKFAIGLNQGVNAFENAYAMAGIKYDTKMVKQAERQLNMTVTQKAAFQREIELDKLTHGKPNYDNFSYADLLDLGREVMKWNK
jgi:hypothetical protein